MSGKKTLAVLGLGNLLAGDDGAGVEAVRRLEKTWGGEEAVFFHTIEGDHFEIADLLGRAERFIFVDSFAGERPGELVRKAKARRAFAPSFHQTDIGAVMYVLESLGISDPFPPWEIWGVTILPPCELGEGLSPEVDEAVNRLCGELDGLIKTLR